jgi:hypothetical protein
MTLSTPQLAVLRLIADGKVSMYCLRWVWRFKDEMGDSINRRTVKALEDAGLVQCSYYRDSAGVGLTQAGRDRIAIWDKNRRRAA